MDDYNLPFWIYLAVVTVFVGGAMKKILASHLSAAPPLVAWLGATVLVERLWALCLPAMLLLALLALACCLYSTRTGPPPAALSTHGKAILITGKTRPHLFCQVCVCVALFYDVESLCMLVCCLEVKHILVLVG